MKKINIPDDLTNAGAPIKIPKLEKRYTNDDVKLAQIEIISWLIGRCEEQMVRAWLINERHLLEKIGGAISKNGGGYE